MRSIPVLPSAVDASWLSSYHLLPKCSLHCIESLTHPVASNSAWGLWPKGIFRSAPKREHSRPPGHPLGGTGMRATQGLDTARVAGWSHPCALKAWPKRTAVTCQSKCTDASTGALLTRATRGQQPKAHQWRQGEMCSIHHPTDYLAIKKK